MEDGRNEECLKRVWNFVSEASYGNLTTIGRDGFPRTRAMEDHNPYDDLTFWFATPAGTRKVEEIRNRPEASVYYDLAGQGQKGYICVLGRAEVRTDEESRRYLWREEWKEYWPGGPLSEKYTPIRIVPEKIEYYNEDDPEAKGVVVLDVLTSDRRA